jgi:hypothetical protein
VIRFCLAMYAFGQAKVSQQPVGKSHVPVYPALAEGCQVDEQ